MTPRRDAAQPASSEQHVEGSTPLLAARGLTLRVGERTVVDAVDLAIRSGEVVGLVGRNGAGKTTLLHLLLGLVTPDAGTIDRAPDLRTGAAFDALAMPPRHSVARALELLGSYGGASGRDPEAFGWVEDIADRRVDALSHGMRQRVSVAGAILGQPRLVLLDEPYNGLDPIAATNLTRLLQRLARQGTGVLVSTHYLAELDVLCDRLVLLEDGRVVADERTGPLVRPRVELQTSDDAAAAVLLAAAGHDVHHGDELVLHDADRAAVGRAVRGLVEAGLDVHAVVPVVAGPRDLVDSWLRGAADRQ